MKNILWKSGSLQMGGSEKALIEILKNINLSKIKINLLIDNNYEEKNIFEKDIPKEINYYFLKPKKLINILDFCQKKKKNFFYKILYNIMLVMEKIVITHNMKRIIKKIGKVDVLIDYDAGATKYIKKFKGINKKIVWIHSSILNSKKKKLKISRFGKRLSHYDNIVVICDEMFEETKKIYPFLEKKLVRIYNSFNFDEILSKSKNENILSKKEKKLIKEKYILAVSRLDMESKDYKTLLESFYNLNEPTYKLYIIGDGPDKEKIENLIKQYNLGNKVYLLGKKQDPYTWMKKCQFFVHSSKYEGFGLVILEALILKKAVISSNCKVGPSEILSYGKYGELFNVGDCKALTQKMRLFIENKTLREKYENLSKEAIERFNTKKIMKEIEKLLLEG